MGFYSGKAYIPIKDQPIEKVSNLKKDTRRKFISSVINSIVYTMTFNTTCYAIDKKQSLNIESEHIKTDENGKIYITLDTYEGPHYNLFTEMIIDLNIYKFSQVDSRYDNHFEYVRYLHFPNYSFMFKNFFFEKRIGNTYVKY